MTKKNFLLLDHRISWSVYCKFITCHSYFSHITHFLRYSFQYTDSCIKPVYMDCWWVLSIAWKPKKITLQQQEYKEKLSRFLLERIRKARVLGNYAEIVFEGFVSWRVRQACKLSCKQLWRWPLRNSIFYVVVCNEPWGSGQGTYRMANKIFVRTWTRSKKYDSKRM